MQETTVISVKTDKRTKVAAQKVAHNLGIPLSTIMNAHLRQLVRDKAVSVSMEPRFLPEKERELLELVADARAGRNISPAFSNMEDAVKWLHSTEK